MSNDQSLHSNLIMIKLVKETRYVIVYLKESLFICKLLKCSKILENNEIKNNENRYEKEQKCSADKYLDQVNKPEYKIRVRPNYIYKAILSNLFFFSICHLKKKKK